MSNRARGHIGEALNTLAELRLSNATLDTIFEHICHAAVRTLEGWEAAAGSLAHGGEFATFGVSDKRIHAIDQAQYSSGKGPCVDAVRTGEMQYFDGQDVPPKWRHFAENAADRGVYSVFSLPLKLEGEVIGGLNLYSPERDALRSGQQEDAMFFAAYTAVAVANWNDLASAKSQAEQLKQGLESRTMIGQATGLLMAHEGLTSSEAFQKLVQLSQISNVKLREIAKRYVDAWEAKVK